MALSDQLAATREILAASEGVDLTPFDNLTQSFGDVEEGFQLRLAEKDEVITQLQAEVARLKSVNYDLMQAAPKPSDEDGDEDSDEDEDEDEPSEGRAIVDSMLD